MNIACIISDGIFENGNYAIRENDKIIIYNNTSASWKYYSYDMEKWYNLNWNNSIAQINDIGTNWIYLGLDDSYYYNNIQYKSIEVINDKSSISQIGLVKENNSNYLFGQQKIQIEQDNIVEIKEDINKLEKINQNIASVTYYKGEVLMLSDDGIIYKYTDENKLIAMTENTNLKQISNKYALDSQNNIYEYEINEDSITYNLCDEFNIETKIQKLNTIVKDDEILPFVLYENSKAVILKKDRTNEIISNQAIDILDEIIECGDYASAKWKYLNRKKYCILKPEEIELNGPDQKLIIKTQDFLQQNEKIIKINNLGMVLTNKGNLYVLINEMNYNYELYKNNVKRLGDYTYQTIDDQIYYINSQNKITNINKRIETRPISLQIDDINVEKDETNISQNDVKIKITIPENKYTLKLPDGNETTSSTTYTVTENGVYPIIITNADGFQAVKTVHVTNIQDRKETKIPEVSVVDGMIKLVSDANIEYCLDENISNESIWVNYIEELKYEKPFYARVVDNNFHCSIIKIILEDDKNLKIENLEQREIKAQILTNSIGDISNFDFKTIQNDNSKVLQMTKQAALIVADSANKNKGIFEYLSELTQNIIYDYSITDGEYAGCYFPTAKTEITYKDINNDILTINEDISIKQSEERLNLNIDYAVIKNNYIEVGNEIKEDTKSYVYIDNNGNLGGNIEIINKFKESIGEDIKYTKIVGDGQEFYILTQDGDVYVCKKYNSTSETIFIAYIKSNIVDIYDSATALNKDGKKISLAIIEEEEVTAVKELQAQTDKYLISTHLGLKNGKLYDFSEIANGLEVVKGKIIKFNKEEFERLSEEKKNDVVGIYSEIDDTIKYFNRDGGKNEANVIIPTELKEGESYITAEEIAEDLPEFVDIAEYREGFLEGIINKESKTNYVIADKYTKCIAVTKQGEIYAYINGYAVDTGINLDYFGPIANYSIDNTKWTNKNINASLSSKTTNEIVETKIEKLATNNRRMSLTRNANIPDLNNEKEIETNGTYIYTAKDRKNRSYSGTFKVDNIDKLKPEMPVIEVKDNKLKIDFKDDKEATEDYAKSGIAKRLISYDNENWEEVGENGILLNVKKDILVYAKTIDNAGNESDVAVGSLSKIIGTVIVKYEDLNGKELKESKLLSGEEGLDYTIEKEKIENYEFTESDKPLSGKYTAEEEIITLKYKKIEIPEPQPDPQPDPQPEPQLEPETGKIEILYQDKDGNKLKDPDNLTGLVGTEYKTIRKEIEGYKLAEIVGNEEGKFRKENQFVIYKYEKIEEKKPESKKDENIIIHNKEEKDIIPQTGQSRIIYISLGIVIIVAIIVLVIVKIKGKNKE